MLKPHKLHAILEKYTLGLRQVDEKITHWSRSNSVPMKWNCLTKW